MKNHPPSLIKTIKIYLKEKALQKVLCIFNGYWSDHRE